MVNNGFEVVENLLNIFRKCFFGQRKNPLNLLTVYTTLWLQQSTVNKTLAMSLPVWLAFKPLPPPHRTWYDTFKKLANKHN